MDDIKALKPDTVSVGGIALELLQEVKRQSKRWMIAFFIVLVCWLSTIGGFMWYLNQYEFFSCEVNTDGGGDANYIGEKGDIINGTYSSTKTD